MINDCCVCVCFQGYTALHLASIHGHEHVVQALINTYSESLSFRHSAPSGGLQYGSQTSSSTFVSGIFLTKLKPQSRPQNH